MGDLRKTKITITSIVAIAILLGIVGTLSNWLVLTVNNGKMPVMVIASIGEIETNTHTTMTADTKLNFLADIFVFESNPQPPSLVRTIIASQHPVKTAVWGEGLGYCAIEEACIASIGDFLRWIFAALMSIFFIPLIILGVHETIVNRRQSVDINRK